VATKQQLSLETRKCAFVPCSREFVQNHHRQKFCSKKCQVKEANRKFAEKRKSQQRNRDLYSMDEGERREELRKQKHMLDPLYFS
jgi:hypothetical protein